MPESRAQFTLEASERYRRLEHQDTILAKCNLSLVPATTEAGLYEAVRMQKEMLEDYKKVFGESRVEMW